MTWLSVACGVALVALIAVDLWLTVLHPTVRGPVTYRVERISWVTIRALADLTGTGRLLTFAGPTALVASLLVWLAGLWIGYALIYLPYLESGFAYAPSVSFASTGPVEALYVSGASLATVGFGDVVGRTDVLRLVTVAEAASGFAVISGAITYVITVYSQLSVLRTAAVRMADGGADTPAGAARLLLTDRDPVVGEVQEALLTVQQSFRQFPILYYFHTERQDESVLTLLRAASLVSLELRWGIAAGERRALAFHHAALPTTLERTMEELTVAFVGGRGGHMPEEPEADDVSARLRTLRAAVADADPQAAACGEPEPGFEALLGRSEAFLAALAHQHRYPYRRLLDGAGA